MNEDNLIEKISQEIASGSVIPFVGAGFSKYAGYPLWGELLKEIVCEANKNNDKFKKIFAGEVESGFHDRIDRNELQQAADFIDKHIDNIPQYINSIFEKIRKKENEVISAISDWSCSTIITTNYDCLLSDILTENKVKYSKYTYKQLSQIVGKQPDNTRLVHIHGNLDDIDSVIFSEKDINDKIISNKIFTTFISDCFINKKFLFLGYGISDPHINSLIKFLSHNIQAGIEHYAILKCDEIDCDRFKSDYSINVLRVDSFTDGDSNFINCLRKINHKTKENYDKKESENKLEINRQEHVRKAKLKTIKKFKYLAGIQNLDISKKALLYLIVQEGLKIIGENNKTFNIHLVESEYMIVVAEGGVNRDKRSNDKKKPLTKGLVGKVYADKLNYFYAAFVDDYGDDYDNMNPTTKSELIISLKDEDENIIGALNIESSKDNGFTDEDIEIMQVVAAQVAIALENKRKYDLLSHSVSTTKLIYENDSYKLPYDGQHDLDFHLNPLLTKMAKSLCSSKAKAGIFSIKEANIHAIACVGFDEKSLKEVIKKNLNWINKVILEHSKNVAQIDNNVLYTIDNKQDEKILLYFNLDNRLKITHNEESMISLYASQLRYHIRLWNSSILQHKKSYESNLYRSLYEATNENHDKDVFLKKVADIICIDFDVDWCFIYVKDYLYPYKVVHEGKGNIYVLKSLSGIIHKIELEKTSYSSGEGLTGSVASTNQYVISSNVFDDPRNSGKNKAPYIDARGFCATSFLGVPIRSPINRNSQYSGEELHNVTGIITTGRERDDLSDDRVFTNDEAILLLRVASIVGKEMQLYSSNKRDYERYSKLLNEASREFSTSKCEKDIFTTLATLVPKYMGEQNFSIFRLYDGKVLKMVTPEKYLNMNPPEFSVGEGLTGNVVSKEGPIFTLNFDSGLDNCRNFWRRIISTDDRYFLGVPIFAPDGKNIYGVFTLNGRIPSSFNPSFYEKITTEIVCTLCNQITLCLGKIQTQIKN
ncbi:MAG: GAF domain-containing protein [Epsilonproteobacteria bacterium]|nr:GAF domain-containing protein [Campylobacterota bacterium]